MSVCSNCGTTQGPFHKSWGNTGNPICKNTKTQIDRVTKCVERRQAADEKKYQELLHGYAA